jgi:hypothetical protein
LDRFSTNRFLCKQITLAQFSEVATLYSDNPDYWNSIAGASPTPAMVAKDLEAGEVGRFPKLGFFDAHQQLIGVCYLNRDFLAAHVWHIEFFWYPATCAARALRPKFCKSSSVGFKVKAANGCAWGASPPTSVRIAFGISRASPIWAIGKDGFSSNQ